jgi:hypothetical protein
MQWTELSQESAAVHVEYGPISLKGLHAVMARLANAINLRILFMVTVGTMFGRGLSLTLKTESESKCALNLQRGASSRSTLTETVVLFHNFSPDVEKGHARCF